ncbi:cysteine peptidase family C39 domain-containing protein, partial [Bacillus toyonensis]
MKRKKFPLIKQHDLKDCGPACLAMISRYYGLSISISRIREVAGTDLQGTNIKGVLEAGERLGFEMKGVKATNPEALNTVPLPTIAHVLDEGLLHYVVIYKVKKNKIFIADPEKGLVTYSLDEFTQIWTGILVLVAPGYQF